MIWFLALLLLASVAALGYRQGAIKVGISTLGILLGAILAVPLSRPLKFLMAMIGPKDPFVQYLIAPVIVFFAISFIAKIIAAQVHQRIDVHYKYHAGELRMALWERLNHRLGGCLGVLNGALYLVLLGAVIFPLSYATYQVASSDEDPRWMRLLNSIGSGMQDTGFHKVARSLDRRATWYQAADFAGTIFHNSPAEARVARYPAFLGLSEKQEFQDLAADKEFSDMRTGKKPFMDVINHPKVLAMRKNPDFARTIWAAFSPDIKDADNFIRTGISARYDKESILGRWLFDANQAMLSVRRAKPNMSSREAQNFKRWFTVAFTNTMLVAMTDNTVLLKNAPQVRVPPAPSANPAAPTPIPTATQTLNGQWKGGNGTYQITISNGGNVDATVDGDRLKMNFDSVDMAFLKVL